jgi:hypothetical protein
MIIYKIIFGVVYISNCCVKVMEIENIENVKDVDD